VLTKAQLLFAAIFALPLVAGAQILSYADGHMDLGVRLEAGSLVGFWKNDAATVNGVTNLQEEFDAGALRAVGIFDSVTPAPLRPPGSQWDFMGVAAGEPIYILPSGGIPNTLPYLGFSTEHTSVAFMEEITFTLTGFSGPAGSTFNLYTSSSNIWMTGTNSSTTGSITLEVGDHQHYAWAFSHLGVYDLSISFVDDTGDYFGSSVFRFEIVPQIIPEPTSAILVLASLSWLFARRRLASPRA